jgi:hypothetical protein
MTMLRQRFIGGAIGALLALAGFYGVGIAQEVINRNFGTPATLPINLASSQVNGTLTANKGGTGLTTVTDDTALVANGTTWQSKVIADCDDTAGNHLNYDTGTNAFSCGTSGSGGSGTTGTFTLTWTDACTTSPTTEVDYTLDDTGTVVTWYIGPMSVSSCTSDSTAFTTSAGDVPANLRPPSGESFVLMGVRYVDNGTAGGALGCLRITDSGVVLVHQAANGCLGGAWTGSGAKAVNGTAAVSTSATYRLHP